jgi:hypothetical protein
VSARLGIELASEPMERVAAELAVAFRFDEDRPLRGPAARADWRLCGELSRLVAGADAGPASRALLVPSDGRLRAGRLLLLCLGPAESFAADDCARAVCDATRRILDLRVHTVALGPPGDWLERIPVGIAAQACVRGAVAALEGSEASLEIRLVVPPERAARAIRGLEAVVADLRDRSVTVVLPRAECAAPARPPATRAGVPPPGGPGPG